MHAQPPCATRHRRWPTPLPPVRSRKRPSLTPASQRELVALSLLLLPDEAGAGSA